MRKDVDVSVIGAGPAGLAAATEASSKGLSVVLFDEQPEPGGQIFRNIETFENPALGQILGEDYLNGSKVVEKFRVSSVDYRPSTSVWRVNPDGIVAWSDGKKARILKSKKIIAATGALERPTPIPGWTLPGVMSVGAAQILLKTSGMVPKGPTAIAGNGPLLYLTAHQLFSAGAEITVILDTTSLRDYVAAIPHVPKALRASEYLVKGAKLIQNLRRNGLRIESPITDIRAHGNGKLQKISYSFRGQTFSLAADTLLLHQGVVPNIQLSRQIGSKHEWHKTQRYWQPITKEWGTTTIKSLAVVGDGAGIFGSEAAEISGQLAGLETAHNLAKIDLSERDAEANRLLIEHKRIRAVRPLLDKLYRPHKSIRTPDDDTIVCRCEEVTAGEVRKCIREGATGPNQLKAYTRCGMGPCQGRMCGLSVVEIIAEARQKPIEEIGYYRVRPPIKPLTLGELAAMENV